MKIMEEQPLQEADKEEKEMFDMHVYYAACDGDTARRFYEEVKAAGIIDATRSEEGNLLYEYYFSSERENEILLLEKWKDKESQRYHDGLPHIAKLGEIKKKYGIETSAEEI